MRKGFYLLVVFTLFGVNVSLAQKFNIKTYSVNEGLPSSSVYDVHKDKNGFLWFATASGLVKYNGQDFKTYGTEIGLKDDLVYDFYFEEDGEMWVSTEFGGLAKFDSKKAEYLPELEELDTLVINFITGIRENELWLGTNEIGVAIWDQETGSISHLSEEDGLPSNQIWDIYFESDSEVWITTMYGIGVYNRESGIVKTYTQEDGLSGELTYQITRDQIGRIWVATSNGVSIIQPDGNIDTITEIDGEKLDYVYTIHADQEGTVWIGTERRGLILIEPDGTTTKVKRQNGLSSNFIYRIVEDSNKNVWIATDGNGVSLFKDRSFLKYDMETDLNSNLVLSLSLDIDSTIWIGTEKGLSSLKNGAFTNYNIPNQFFDQDEIWDIEILPNGNLLLLTYTYEIFQFDGERFFYPDFYDEFYETYINDIFVDEDGSLWLAAFQQLSHLKDGVTTHYFPPDDSYFQVDLWYLYRDSRGILWIATEGGLAKFEDGEFEYLTEEAGIPDKTVYEIVEDQNNNLWVGTIGGIAFIKHEDILAGNYEFTSFLSGELFTHETVFLLFDNNGGLWQGTNAGINYFDLSDWDYSSKPIQLHFPLTNNRDAVEFNGGAKIVDYDGTIWFGTYSTGLVSFDYEDNEDALETSVPPEIFLRSILASGEEIFGQNSQSIQDEKLDIEFAMNDITYVFNAIDYYDPDNISIRYRLIGYDSEWEESRDITELRYANLPPGDYTLQVSAKSIKSDWSEITELATISVLKPFYLTVPFFAGIAIFLGLIIYLYVNSRVSKIEKKELQKLVDQQTEDLSTALLEKEVLIKEIHHRVKNNLAVVSGLLELQGFRMPAGSAKMAIQESKMRVIAMSKIHENLYQNHDLANVDFRRFINELVKSIQATMNMMDKNIEVVQYIDEAFLDVNIGVPLGLVTNELVSNCYKHAFKGKKEGCISISFEEKEETYVLKVEDDGVGTSRNILDQKQKSLGITLIKSLSVQINAYLEYTNQVGSCFTLTVPKQQAI